MEPMLQPQGSSLCGQTCVAMAAGVSLESAIEAVGHARRRGTYTSELVGGLRALGVECASRLRLVSRLRPLLPKRAIVSMVVIKQSPREARRGHWMLAWDGVIYDPEGMWPGGYTGWKLTSYLEITGG